MSFFPAVLVFASGSKDGGGSGFENLVTCEKTREVNPANIVGVVSNHEAGGIFKRAQRLKIPFFHFPKPWTAEGYKKLMQDAQAEFAALSGWLKPVAGLDPRKTFNIHPGPIGKAGDPGPYAGPGMYGHHVHEKVILAYKQGLLNQSEVCMHFVTDNVDGGPVFFRHPVPITDDDTAETLAAKVNVVEHRWQPLVTELVVMGHISWDGKDPNSLQVPKKYGFL